MLGGGFHSCLPYNRPSRTTPYCIVRVMALTLEVTGLDYTRGVLAPQPALDLLRLSWFLSCKNFPSKAWARTGQCWPYIPNIPFSSYCSVLCLMAWPSVQSHPRGSGSLGRNGTTLDFHPMNPSMCWCVICLPWTLSSQIPQGPFCTRTSGL